jgi:hypothetical protein
MFGIMVSEVSSPDRVASFWAWGNMGHYGGSVWQRGSTHLVATKKQRKEERERLCLQYPLQSHPQ